MAPFLLILGGQSSAGAAAVPAGLTLTSGCPPLLCGTQPDGTVPPGEVWGLAFWL